GTVLGTVTDSSGAVVPNVEVKLNNLATGIISQRVTNAQGQYVFPEVPPGAYTLTLQKAGFRTSTLHNVTVQVNKSFTADVQMDVGEVSQRVEVVASAQAELQTTDAQVGDVVSGQTLQHLPRCSGMHWNCGSCSQPRHRVTATQVARFPAHEATRIRS